MPDTIAAQINALRRMTAGELRKKYREVFGEDSRSGNKDWLWKRIAWRIQELEYGGLSERAKQRAAELANEHDIRLSLPRGAFADTSGGTRNSGPKINGALSQDRRIPMPGAIINRQYKGTSFQVTVLSEGFEYDGRVFRSLSAVAQEITGSHWNGFKFFDL